MRARHWTDDELVSKVFDVAPEDGHLETCPECRQRWELIRNRYESRPAAVAEVPDPQWTAQRLAVRARIEGKARWMGRILAPSLATALVAALVGFLLLRPIPPEPTTSQALPEEEIMEEVFRMSFSLEPAAIEPVRSLFEEQP